MIPLSTTTVTVSRVALDPTRDSYDAEPTASAIATGVRAHISSPSGQELQRGGTQAVTQYRLDCDPVDLLHTDRIVDETDGTVYEVTWAVQRRGYGLDHVEAGMRRVEGEP